MLPRLCRQQTALLVILMFVSLPLTTHQARRSRIDLPIQSSANAPPEDNIATASGTDEVVQIAPQSEALTANNVSATPSSPVVEAASPGADSSAPVAAAVTAQEPERPTEMPPSDTPTVDECETDNLGYEIVTG